MSAPMPDAPDGAQRKQAAVVSQQHQEEEEEEEEEEHKEEEEEEEDEEEEHHHSGDIATIVDSLASVKTIEERLRIHTQLRAQRLPDYLSSREVGALADHRRYTFQKRWLELQGSWLVYSQTENAGFCATCLLFCTIRNVCNFHTGWTTGWQKPSEKFAYHLGTRAHEEAQKNLEKATKHETFSARELEDMCAFNAVVSVYRRTKADAQKRVSDNFYGRQLKRARGAFPVSESAAPTTMAPAPALAPAPASAPAPAPASAPAFASCRQLPAPDFTLPPPPIWLSSAPAMTHSTPPPPPPLPLPPPFWMLPVMPWARAHPGAWPLYFSQMPCTKKDASTNTEPEAVAPPEAD